MYVSTTLFCYRLAKCPVPPSVTEALSMEAMRLRLHWWLSGISGTDSDPIRRRVQLIAANVVGKHSEL